MPLSPAPKTMARRPVVVRRGTLNPSPVAADVVWEGLKIEDCALMLNSGSDSWFAEIDPFRYWVERDGSVDVGVAAEAVDVDADSAARMAEEFVHHNLSGFVCSQNTGSRVQEFVTPNGAVSKIVHTDTEVVADAVLPLIVDNRSDDLTSSTICHKRRVDRDVVDDGILRKSEKGSLEKSSQRRTHKSSRRRNRCDEGEEPRFRIDGALDHRKKVTGSERRIPLKPGGLI